METVIHKVLHDMTDKDTVVIYRMRRYGGSFVKALAECFLVADATNFKKLKKAFGQYWREYERPMFNGLPKE